MRVNIDVDHSSTHANGHSTINRELACLNNLLGEQLLRYAVSLTQNRDLGHDAVQEAFLRYLLYRRRGLGIENPQAWLYRVVQNVTRDARRQSDWVSLDGVDLKNDDPTDEWLRRIDARTIARHTRGLLSHREFDCVRLRLEGLRYDEIGNSLRLQPGTVGALLNRAFTKVKRATAMAEA